MEKPKGSSFVLILVLLTPLCSVFVNVPVQAASSEDDWPMFRHDAAHSGYSPSSVAAEELEVLWTAPKRVGGSPVIADGYVYIDDGNDLRCLNASDGTEIWKCKSGSSGASYDYTPAVYGGYVYTSFFACDALTGEPLLNYSVYSGNGSPVVVDGILYSGCTYNGGIFAMNATTGTKLWRFTGVSVVSSPAVTNGYVYFATKDGYVYALDALSGDELWKYKVSGNFEHSSPAVAEGRVYIGSSDNAYCLDALAGTKIWNNSDIGRAQRAYPAVANGFVYIGMQALNASTGATIWGEGRASWPSPSVAGDIVITSDSYGVSAVNASTGTGIWRYEFPNPFVFRHFTAAIADGVVYACSENDLYAFGTPPTPNWISPLFQDTIGYNACELELWDTQLVDRWGRFGSIAFDSNNNPHFCYSVRDERTIRRGLHYGVWNGTNLNRKIVDQTAGGGIIAVDANDYPHIVYRSGDTLKHAFWNGKKWTINSVDSPCERYFDMATDSMGTPHLVYLHSETLTLKHAFWNGSEWVINDLGEPLTGGGKLTPSIVLDSNNYPRIVYIESLEFEVDKENSSEKEVHVTHSVKYAAWKGSDWFLQTVEHNVSELGSFGNLALDSNENPHLCYFSEGALNYAHWDGSTWVVHTLDSKSIHDNMKPYVWMDKNNSPNLYFVHYNSSSGPYDDPCSLFRATWAGSTWNVVTVDSNIPRIETVVMDSEGKLHLLLYESVGTNRGAWLYGRLTYATLIEDTPTTEPQTSWIAVPLTIATIVCLGLVIYYYKKRKH